jgi:hypothetical protein
VGAPEALGERRKRLCNLLSRHSKAMREGVQLSEAIPGDGDAIFAMLVGWAWKAMISKRNWLTVREWPDTRMAEVEEPSLSAAIMLDCFPLSLVTPRGQITRDHVR